MGTDIHLHVERFENDKDWPGWRPVPFRIIDCYWCKATGVNEKSGKPCSWCAELPSNYHYALDRYAGVPGKVRNHWYSDRNYDVFAILADVRNGRGFAGVVTGEGFNIISEPRGIPGDVSSEILDEWEKGGDHTPSWLTLDEIEAFDWDQGTTHYGMVTAGEYLVFLKKGQPSSWCGGVSGGGIKIVNNEEMQRLIDLDKEFGTTTHTKGVYTQVRWKETYAESAEGFLEAMEELQAMYPNDKLRIVFWFDS